MEFLGSASLTILLPPPPHNDVVANTILNNSLRLYYNTSAVTCRNVHLLTWRVAHHSLPSSTLTFQEHHLYCRLFVCFERPARIFGYKTLKITGNNIPFSEAVFRNVVSVYCTEL
jgi:hypothetical protein